MPQREFPLNPLVGVGAVIVDPLGRVLLIQRATEPRKGHWSIPGGLVELGEPLLHAVQREVAEETGLRVQPHAIIEVVDRIVRQDEQAPIRYHYVIVDYWCSILDGEAHPSSDAADLAWAAREDWLGANSFALESITIAVIEKGWQLANAAGNHG